MYLYTPSFKCPMNHEKEQEECNGCGGAFCEALLKHLLELQLEKMAKKILEEMPAAERENLLTRISNMQDYESTMKGEGDHEG